MIYEEYSTWSTWQISTLCSVVVLVFYVYWSVPSQRSDWNHDPWIDCWIDSWGLPMFQQESVVLAACALFSSVTDISVTPVLWALYGDEERECRLKYEWWDCHSLSSARNLDGFLKNTANIKEIEDGFRNLCSCTRKISVMSLISVPNKLPWQDKPGSSITKIIGDYCVTQYSILPTWELSQVMNFE